MTLTHRCRAPQPGAGAARCQWLVPGLLKEKVCSWVKTLPQKTRAKLVPVPEFAAEFAEKVVPLRPGLVPALIAFIMETRGLNARGWAATPDAFRPGELPAHLSMNFKLVDEHGRQLDMRRNLTELRAGMGRAGEDRVLPRSTRRRPPPPGSPTGPSANCRN